MEIFESEIALRQMKEDQFGFVPVVFGDKGEEESLPLTVRIWCDVVGAGRSVWLNETTVTPGEGFWDGE